MFKAYSVVLQMRQPPARPLADAAPAVFEHLLSIFAPRRFVYAVDLGELRYLSHGERGRWNGEELTTDALTLCPRGDAGELVAELRRALATTGPAQLWVGAEGALHHRAPRAHAPAWHGRWRMGRLLNELVELAFGWSDDLRGLEIRFPNEGYPLTATELRAQPSGERWIDGGDPTAAADNRAQVFEALAGLPGVLGLGSTDIAWELHGDANALAARYPDDARALDAQLARLRS